MEIIREFYFGLWFLSQCLCFLFKSNLPYFLSSFDFWVTLSVLLRASTVWSAWGLNRRTVIDVLFLSLVRIFVVNFSFYHRRNSGLTVEVAIFFVTVGSITLAAIKIAFSSKEPVFVTFLSFQIFIIVCEFFSVWLHPERKRKRRLWCYDRSISAFSNSRTPSIPTRPDGRQFTISSVDDPFGKSLDTANALQECLDASLLENDHLTQQKRLTLPMVSSPSSLPYYISENPKALNDVPTNFPSSPTGTPTRKTCHPLPLSFPPSPSQIHAFQERETKELRESTAPAKSVRGPVSQTPIVHFAKATATSSAFDDCYEVMKVVQTPHVSLRDWPEPRSLYVHFSEVAVHVKTAGFHLPCPDRLIVLLHQFAGWGYTWRQIMNRLANSANARVVSFDRVGHGFTTRPTRGTMVNMPFTSEIANPYSQSYSVELTHALVRIFGARTLAPHLAATVTEARCCTEDGSFLKERESQRESYSRQNNMLSQMDSFRIPSPASQMDSFDPIPRSVCTWLEKESPRQVNNGDKGQAGPGTPTANESLPSSRLHVVLVGCAAGGRLALECAAQADCAVDRVVVVSPAVYSEGIPDILRAVFHTSRLGRALTLSLVKSELTDFMLKRSFFFQKNLAPAVISGYKRPMQEADFYDGLHELMRNSSRYARGLEKLEHLSQVKVLILKGAKDAMLPPRETTRLLRDLSKFEVPVTFEVVKDCGHLPQEEKPDELLQIMVSFIQEN